MNLTNTLRSTISTLTTNTSEPDQPPCEAIERRAEELEHGTRLSWHEAAVLAGDELGATNRRIGRVIGRGDGTIRKIRYDIREKRRELEDEQDIDEQTLDVLREQ